MIRVIVADDHPIVRSGIVGLVALDPGLDVGAVAAAGAVAGPRATRLRPDVVPMALRMPGTSGIEATARITEELPDVRVLVLTTYETDDDILGAIEAGASGYLLKAAPHEEIVAGIRSVAEGHSVLAPSIAATLVTRMRSERVDRPALSARELEVLRLVAAGHSNPEIGRVLFIGEATVKTHLLHVFEKLGVSDRTRAVTLALELGIL